MKYITKEVRIGIAGIAALCILVYGINYLKGIHMFKPSNYFYVQFQNIVFPREVRPSWLPICWEASR